MILLLAVIIGILIFIFNRRYIIGGQELDTHDLDDVNRGDFKDFLRYIADRFAISPRRPFIKDLMSFRGSDGAYISKIQTYVHRNPKDVDTSRNQQEIDIFLKYVKHPQIIINELHHVENIAPLLHSDNILIKDINGYNPFKKFINIIFNEHDDILYPRTFKELLILLEKESYKLKHMDTRSDFLGSFWIHVQRG